jgi:hypothetical protein
MILNIVVGKNSKKNTKKKNAKKQNGNVVNISLQSASN